MHSLENEGPTLKTIFFAINTEFYINYFPVIKNKEDYRKIFSNYKDIKNFYAGKH